MYAEQVDLVLLRLQILLILVGVVQGLLVKSYAR